jgi:uncharacterized protein (TIGR01777 family)
MRILVVGASGFIGSSLSKYLSAMGHIVVICGRKQTKNPLPFPWLSFHELSSRILESFEVVIHLSGAPILGWRWSESYKKELEDSRIETTARLSKLILACQQPPKVWIQASATGYYPDSHGPYTESSEPGKDFLAKLCRKWERASEALIDSPTRRCVLRLGLVLSKHSGALSKMLPAFYLGLGGPIGHGKQIYSWIHIEDVCRMVEWLLHTPQASGPFNATSPGFVDQKTFAQTLGKALNRPTFIPLPEWVLNLTLGEAAKVLTRGSAIIPQNALDQGFEFKFLDISSAIHHLLS